jgi:PBP1b-binding outer membrane lipoprotein LpoB
MKKLKQLLTTAFWEFITWIFWIIIIASILLSCRSLDMMSYKEFKQSELNRYKDVQPPDWQDILKPNDTINKNKKINHGRKN